MFDVISVVVGAAAAVILAGVLFSQRERIQALRERASSQVTETRTKLSRNMEARYRDAVIGLANGAHLAGHLVELERIAVLPRFFTLPAPFDPSDEDPEGHDNPLNIIPKNPDWPQVLAPYRLPGVTLADLLRSTNQIALLGLPGSGRTTTLNLIGILLARQTAQGQAGSLLDEPRMPVLAHLGDIDLGRETWGDEIDILEPLLAAARESLPAATRALAVIRGDIAAGDAVLLIDGWEELPTIQQRRVISWLQALNEQYPGNIIVMTGPARGYGPLITTLGFTPIVMMPWHHDEYRELAQHWAAVWSEIGDGDTQRGNLDDAVTALRSRSPFEATLKVWASYAGDTVTNSPTDWLDSYLSRVNPEPDLQVALEQVAREMVEKPQDFGAAVDEITAQIDLIRASMAADTTNAIDYVYNIAHRTRLMREHYSNRIAFRHPLIMAYLAARAVRRDETPARYLLERRTPITDSTLAYLSMLGDIAPYVNMALEDGPSLSHDDLFQIAYWASDSDPQAAWRGAWFKQMAGVLLGPRQYPDARERALSALLAARDRNVAFIFKQGLKSQEPFVRLLSALGIGALGDPEDVVLLGEVQQDENPGVEMAAVLALGAIGTKAAVNFMLETLLRSTDMPRRAVAEMLAANIAGEGHDILKEALEEEDPLTRRAAVYGLDRLDDDWVIEKLGEVERLDSQWLVRDAAAASIERRRHREVQSIHRPLKPIEIAWLSRWLEAREQLPEDGERGITQLMQMLQAEDDALKLGAIEALGDLGAPSAIAPLYNLLNHPHPDIRDAAHRALTKISVMNNSPLPQPAIA